MNLKARDAVIVLAAHGSTRRPAANETVETHAARMRAGGPFKDVRAAFLLGDAGPADAAREIDAATVLIVPFMMSDGYLAGEISKRIEGALKRRDGGTEIIVTEPVGTHEGIAGIARQKGDAALKHAGFDPAQATLVLVAHGSGNRPESRACGEAHAETIAASGGFADVRLATLEEEPFLDDVLSEIAGPAAVVGLFAAPGGHAIDDVKAAIARQRRADLIDAGPVGVDPAMTALAAMRALSALED
ncbi:MAG: CbiX/SirB N-terminal domain-containing protein [Rhodospirillales bacterium]